MSTDPEELLDALVAAEELSVEHWETCEDCEIAPCQTAVGLIQRSAQRMLEAKIWLDRRPPRVRLTVV